MSMVNMSKVRDLLKIGGTILAAFGIGDEETFTGAVDAIIIGFGGVSAILGIVWTHFASRKQAVVAEAAKEVPIPVAKQVEAGVAPTQVVSPTQAKLA